MSTPNDEEAGDSSCHCTGMDYWPLLKCFMCSTYPRSAAPVLIYSYEYMVCGIGFQQLTSISEHSCLCEAPDAEMYKLDCQCKPASEGVHFSCDCWVAQDPRPAEYLDCLDKQKKGQNESEVYTIQPNELESTEVRLYVENITSTITLNQK